MTIAREPPRETGTGAFESEQPLASAGKSTRSAKLVASGGEGLAGTDSSPAYSFYPPFDGAGARPAAAGGGADDPFGLHLIGTHAGASAAAAPSAAPGGQRSARSAAAVATAPGPMLGPATRLGSAAAAVSDAAGFVLGAVQSGDFLDPTLIRLNEALEAFGDALHEHAGERSKSDEEALRRALRDASAVATRLSSRNTGRSKHEDELRARIGMVTRLAENRTEVVETPHMPQVLTEFAAESLSQLVAVREALGSLGTALPEVKIDELNDAIATTEGWKAAVAAPDASRTQMVRLSKAIVDQHAIMPRAFDELESVLREPLTSSSGQVIAAYVHAMAMSTKRRSIADAALDRARKLRKRRPLDQLVDTIEGDGETLADLARLDPAQARAAQKENKQLEGKMRRLEARIDANQRVSRTEIDELNVEAREQAFRHHLTLLSTNASQAAKALDKMDDGVVGWLAKPDGVSIPRLVDDLRGLSRVTAAAMAGYRERVEIAKEEVEVGDTGDRARVATAKNQALDWAEGFIRDWMATGYYKERVDACLSLMKETETRALLAQFAIILASMLVGNVAGSLAARGVTAARGATVATEVTMGTRALATVASVAADGVASAAVQKAATDDPTSFATLLATNLAVPLAMAPISRNFRNIDDVYRSGAKATTIWEKAGRAGSWGLRRGLELDAEMVAGAAADYMVRRAASADGPPPDEQTQEQWLLQGASIAVGRFVRGAASRIGEPYAQRKARNAEMAARAQSVADLGKMAEDGADVRSAVEALGEYKKLLEADQDALVAELEITHGANRNHKDLTQRLAENQRALGQLDQLGVENLAMRGGGLRPKTDAEDSWEGDATQVQEALVLARNLGIDNVRARYDQKQRRWSIDLGQRRFEVADANAEAPKSPDRTSGDTDDAVPTALPDEPTARMRRPTSAEEPPAGKRPYARARVPDDVEAAIARPENLAELVDRNTGVDKAGFHDRVDNIVKGPAYDEAMSQLREFYTQMEGEAQHVTKNAGRVADGPYRWGYANDAQSFSHGLSNVQFRVHLVARPGVSDADLARVKVRVHRGVDHYYNFKHTVRGADGVERRLHVEVVFVDDAANAHLTVNLHAGDGLAHPSHWFVGGTDTTDAHEIGHGAFGLKDEYHDKFGRPPGREAETSPGVMSDDSLMGDYWLDRITNRVKPGTGLRSRHLDEIARQMPEPKSLSRGASQTEASDGAQSRAPRAPGSVLESLVHGAVRSAAARKLDAIPVSVRRSPENGKASIYLASDADLARIHDLLRVFAPDVQVETFAQGLVIRADGAEWFIERGSDAEIAAGARAPRQRDHVGTRFGLPPANAYTVKFYGFRGVRRVNKVRLDQLTGKDKQAVDMLLKNEPLLYYGHVGISLDGGKTIYGFTPDRASRPDLSDEQFIALVKSNAVLPGLARDDSHVFRLAEKLAREDGWELVIDEITQIHDESAKQRVAEQIVEMTANEGRGVGAGHGLKYQFPRDKPDERGSHFDEECAANCAVYPRFLGLPVPEESGLLSQYIPALKRLAAGGIVDARSEPRWKR